MEVHGPGQNALPSNSASGHNPASPRGGCSGVRVSGVRVSGVRVPGRVGLRGGCRHCRERESMAG